MVNTGTWVKAWVLFAALSNIPGGAQAVAATSPGPLTVSVDGDYVVLRPPLSFERAELRMTGPLSAAKRAWIEYEAPAGDEVVIALGHRLAEGSEGRLRDGIYKWELRLRVADRESSRDPVYSGRLTISQGTVAVPPSEDSEDTSQALGPEPRVGVENHFTTDLGTSQDFCTACSAAFEPGSSLFGGETVMIIDGSPGINFLKSESTADLADGGWELGVDLAQFYLADMNADASSATRPLVIEDGSLDNLLYLDSTDRVGIATSAPQHRLDVNGDARVTGMLTVEGGFAAASSRAIKDGFKPVDGAELLSTLAALPMTTWSYRKDASSIRHLGPVAEDFRAAFGLGRDDRHVDLIDAAGVALAAIQELNRVVRTRDAQIAALNARLGAIEALLRAEHGVR